MDTTTGQLLDPRGLFRLDDKVAVVTGASSGLGERFARVLDAAGARVVVAARRADRLDKLAAGLDGAVAVPADLSLAGDRERLVATTLDQAGRLDVLVNNAGIGRPAALEEEALDDFRDVIEVNLTAVWHLCKLARQALIADGGGSIINVASILGHVGATPIKQASYCASKGAVVNLTRELALQFARRGVTVNALCPGWFPSELTAGTEDDATQAFIARNTPIARMGRAHELDGALLLLERASRLVHHRAEPHRRRRMDRPMSMPAPAATPVWRSAHATHEAIFGLLMEQSIRSDQSSTARQSARVRRMSRISGSGSGNRAGAHRLPHHPGGHHRRFQSGNRRRAADGTLRRTNGQARQEVQP